jgi:single-stranded-DNA-specific exonuclease
MPEQQQWNLVTTTQPPEAFQQLVKKYTPNSDGKFAAQLFWQRGIREEKQLAAFINPQIYQPSNSLEFGEEMQLAIHRLQQAINNSEKVTIWGDFDADGITSTAVLWDGLGQFFTQKTQLNYYIPNRLYESHGLNIPGIEKLAVKGCKLIVTCDTGSTNVEEIIYAQELGIDVIVTDHHTLPSQRPPVAAIINPRYFPKEHSLHHLSGVGVAYKLVEALYQSLPDIPQQPLEDLLDLVAIGLIADLVQLSGDCRYLAQQGINRLQNDYQQPPEKRRRPGVGRLLELCQRSGDRPTDISFGLGPRINAVSRIQGDASFCVELLTSRECDRVQELAEITELANSRRKSLQKDIAQQVNQKLSQLDLSTTSVIVLEDSQWSPGVLGLVAGQVAQETGRPTILLSTEQNNSDPDSTILARGSARSINSVDLYQLVKDQAHLLHRFGGHPFAAGLSLPVENIPIFAQAVNQRLRQTLAGVDLVPSIQADLVVTVADLGKELFLEMKLLEPCGMGNPVPKLLIKNCWFENTWHRNQQDSAGKKIQYIKAEFDIRDQSTKNAFPGVWWGHYKDDLPVGHCDCIAELDYNSFKKRYEIRLVAVRAAENSTFTNSSITTIFDLRNLSDRKQPEPSHQESELRIETCPTSWGELRTWIMRSLHVSSGESDHTHKPLSLAWSKPQPQTPEAVWYTLVGLSKYLSRTNTLVTRVQILTKLGIGDQALFIGLQALKHLGFTVTNQDRFLVFNQTSTTESELAKPIVKQFLAAVQEQQFQQQYFAEVPLTTIQSFATKTILDLKFANGT